ncbi:MAG: TorF family putative porin, partial [Pelodictyon phaeoclathratiforme]
MKKAVKLLSLAVALFAGLGNTAQAAGFKIGADVVSSYVWRGSDLGNSAAIQPALSYTCPTTGIIVGAWGSYAVSEDAGSRYKEIDLYATLPVGPLSLTVTDYNAPDGGDSFDFSDDGPNVVELSVGYAKDNLSLLAAINVAGADNDNAKYCEAGYKFYDKDGYTAKGVVGLGDEDFYGDKEGD